MTPDRRSRTKAQVRHLSASALGRLGIDSHQYWLLVDLLKTLSRRQEIAQLGSRMNSMRKAAAFLAVLYGLLGVVMVYFGVPVVLYLTMLVILTALQLSTLLLPDVAATLVNPSEATVLGHQPITGETWTLAKITHLLRVIVFIVLALNCVPALAGSLLLGFSGWQRVIYAIVHLSVTLAVGLMVGLGCCSVLGWLIRYTPPRRLQAISAVIQVIPMLLMYGIVTWTRPTRETWTLLETPPSELLAAVLASLGMPSAVIIVGLVLLAAWAIVFGLRALSINRLIRSYDQDSVGRREIRLRGSNLLSFISARLGNQVRRSGFVYVSKIMMRDWQFWRNMLSMAFPALVGFGVIFVRGWDSSPFSSKFTTIHLLPHMLGLLALISCRFMAFGSDHKESWIFVIIPNQFVIPFVQGVTLFLLSFTLILPHALGSVVLTWSWPLLDLVLFVLFSALVVVLYLCAGLRFIGGIPFGKRFDPDKSILSLVFLITWGLSMGIAVGMQYLLFLSYFAVVVAIVILLIAALFSARSSVARFAVDIRVHMDEISVR